MPTATSDELIQIATDYLAAIERGTPFEELAQFFTPDCVQEEFPNRFVPDGARRTMADLKSAADRGAKAVENQRYTVLNAIGHDNQVALEVQWTAQVLIPFASLKAGDTMRAHFAVFLRFRDRQIERQHNYD
ncbi:MAG TPA: nuclear transport factor 2 family protein [Thermoanaerobaculia bacterium]|nr:nuclear transport factor 2 family protein [Thermoanaerobaculia bacterium]